MSDHRIVDFLATIELPEGSTESEYTALHESMGHLGFLRFFSDSVAQKLPNATYILQNALPRTAEDICEEISKALSQSSSTAKIFVVAFDEHAQRNCELGT